MKRSGRRAGRTRPALDWSLWSRLRHMRPSVTGTCSHPVRLEALDPDRLIWRNVWAMTAAAPCPVGRGSYFKCMAWHCNFRVKTWSPLGFHTCLQGGDPIHMNSLSREAGRWLLMPATATVTLPATCPSKQCLKGLNTRRRPWVSDPRDNPCWGFHPHSNSVF